LLALEAACDFGHHGIRQAQCFQGLLERLSGPLRLASIGLKALLSVATVALSGFGGLFGVSFCRGHADLLRLVSLSILDR
jgi:hypothetical protein